MCAIIYASGFINEEIEDGVKKHRFDWSLLSDSSARGLMVRFRSDLPHGSGRLIENFYILSFRSWHEQHIGRSHFDCSLDSFPKRFHSR